MLHIQTMEDGLTRLCDENGLRVADVFTGGDAEEIVRRWNAIERVRANVLDVIEQDETSGEDRTGEDRTLDDTINLANSAVAIARALVEELSTT